MASSNIVIYLLGGSEYSPSECLNNKVWSYILKNPDKVLMVSDGVDEFLDISSVANENNYRGDNGEETMPSSALYNKIAKGISYSQRLVHQ